MNSGASQGGAGSVRAGGSAGARREDARLLTGTGAFLDDAPRGDALVACFLRSPYAHARIRSIDTAPARRAPGVAAVLVARDLVADRIGPVPPIALPPVIPSVGQVPRMPVLADGVVRFVGQPVALVVAESRYAALDALDAIAVDYEERPAVAELRAASDSESPQVHEMCPGNLCYHWRGGDSDATAQAFAAAERVVRLELVNNRLAPLTMEGRGAHAEPAGGGGLLLVTGTQVPLVARRLVAETLHMPPEALRVRVPDMGGAFGMKAVVYAEQIAVAWAARRLGRAVRWVAERGEGFLADNHARDARSRVALAIDPARRIRALSLEVEANLGAYVIGHGAIVPLGGTGLLTGVYDIPHASMEVRARLTHTAPVDAYRGAGRPEVMYAVERVMEAAARALGEDPLEFRMRHCVAPESMPHTTPTGMRYEDVDLGAGMREIAATPQWSGREARKAQARSRNRLCGVGIANFVDRTGGGSADEWAAVRFAADGSATLLLGTQASGQGHETCYARIASRLLGIDPGRLSVVQGDSDVVRHGTGTYGSRSMVLGGAALSIAVEDVLGKARAIAAGLLEAAEADLSFADGAFTVAGTDRRVRLEEVAGAAFDPARRPPGLPPGLEGEGSFLPVNFAFPAGCHLCEVEVDPETGRVEIAGYVAADDYGRAVDPRLLEGQVQGGVVQGLGQALLERVIYEPDGGQLLTGSLVDYAVPRADEMPSPELRLRQMPARTNPLGVKGCGEAGCIAAPPAFMNALLDALAPLGVSHLDMPATPERVWRALRDVREQGRPAR